MKTRNRHQYIYWYVRYGPERLFNYIRYDVPQGIFNLITYAPIIWRTREWDSGYLYEIIAFKLRRMEYCIRHGVTIDGQKTANEIKDARLFMERLVKDDYIMKWHKNRKYNPELEQKKDLKLFCTMFLKSVGWWD